MLTSLVDSSLDLVTSLITFFAIREALTPADEDHRFGHGKAEALAGVAQAGFIAASACGVALTVAGRFSHPQPVRSEEVGIAVSALAVLLTLGSDGVPAPRRAAHRVAGGQCRQGALPGRLRHQHQRRRRSLPVEPPRPADDRCRRGVGRGDLSRDRRLGDRPHVGRRADGSRAAGRRPRAYPRNRAQPPRRAQRARSAHALGGTHQVHPDACRVPADHVPRPRPRHGRTRSRPRSSGPFPMPR